MADIEPGLRLHYVTAGSRTRTVVLLHGLPQTWWEWRHVIQPLVDVGLRVVAPDYRGAGDSTHRPSGLGNRTTSCARTVRHIAGGGGVRDAQLR